MKKLILSLVVIATISSVANANECYEPNNPNSFKEAPSKLKELFDKELKSLPLFGKPNKWKTLNFKNMYSTIYRNPKSLDESIPKINGLWQYQTYDKLISDFQIGQILPKKYYKQDVGNAIYKKFGLSKWKSYSDYTVFNEVKFKINNKYFMMKAYMYGLADNNTNLNHTVINYYFHDYTSGVNEYKECKRKELHLQQEGSKLSL